MLSRTEQINKYRRAQLQAAMTISCTQDEQNLDYLFSNLSALPREQMKWLARAHDYFSRKGFLTEAHSNTVSDLKNQLQDKLGQATSAPMSMKAIESFIEFMLNNADRLSDQALEGFVQAMLKRVP